ncbi:MAG: hypothetical protein RLZZ628_1439 [Bacteroidota bacterium]|jgi:predicted transposase YdaD
MAKSTQFINPFTDFGFKKLVGEERRAYEQSVKQYRDLKNVTDTAYFEGKIEGKMEGKIEERLKNIQKAIQRGKLTDAELAEDFDVSMEYVRQIRDTML